MSDDRAVDAERDGAPADRPRPPVAAAHRAVSAPKSRSRAYRYVQANLTFFCVIGAILLVAAAGITWVISPNWGGGGNHGSTPAVRNVGDVPTAPGVTALELLSPDRIEIPRLSAQAPIVDVANVGGSLEVPENPKTVGWWKDGARPGAPKGTAILDGHINFRGVDGVLSRIGTLNPGDTVVVYGKTSGQKAKVAFRITGVRTYSKHALPYQEIFDQKSVGRLAIVTCGGPFDASTGNYRDNIVAFAVPA